MEAHPLWEYPCYALHTPIQLMTLDLRTDLSNVSATHKKSANLDLKTLRRCAKEVQNARNSCFGMRDTKDYTDVLHYNGVAVWTEWHFGEQVISTGPTETVVTGQQVGRKY